LAGLPPSLVSHSSKHCTVDQFRGREVAILGAGASALDLAALLNQAGARVQVLSRKPVIKFHDPPEKLEFSFFDQLRNPITGIGPGWKLFWCANTPLLFRQMPLKFRLDKVKSILGPAPCWFIKEEIIGKVQLLVDVSISEAKVQEGRVCLQLTDSAGTRKSVTVDHVIAATGYKVKLQRLVFMDAQLQSAIRSVEDTPVLSSNFQSTVPGLYFVGASAANTFGPLLRFAFGAGFTAGRLSKHLAKSAIRRPATDRSSSEIEASDRDEVGVR